MYFAGSREEMDLARARHRAPILETFLRGLEEDTRVAVLREMQETLREHYTGVLAIFEA